MIFYSITIENCKDFPDDKNLLLRLSCGDQNTLQSLRELNVKEEYLDEFKDIISKLLTCDQEIKEAILEEIKESNIDNVIIMGEPFNTINRDEISEIIKDIKTKFKDKVKVFLYTEYTFNHLAMESLKTKLEEDAIGDILYTADGLIDGIAYPDSTKKPVHYLDLVNTLKQAKIIRG